MASWIVGGLIVIAVIFALRSVKRQSKKGGCSGCSGGCNGCPHHENQK